MITQPIILVVEGIIISITLWKLIKNFNRRYGEIVINNVIVPGESTNASALGTYLKDMKATNITILKNGIIDIGTIIFNDPFGSWLAHFWFLRYSYSHRHGVWNR